MIRYPHFALENLYLVNGYRRFAQGDDLELEFVAEEQLEESLRILVLHKPGRLTGHELRYLRRGLELTQTEFGQMVDRDAQTVARWEKSSDFVPQSVDVMIRMRFSARFQPGATIDEILSQIDGALTNRPGSIFLFYDGADWKASSSNPIPYFTNVSVGVVVADLPVGPGRMFTVLEGQVVSRAQSAVPQFPTVTLPSAVHYTQAEVQNA